MKYLKTIYLLLCCTLALAACSDDDENSASGALSITRRHIRMWGTTKQPYPPISAERKE